MKTIVFLVSGNGGTQKFIHQVQPKFSDCFKIIASISDRHCGAIEYAEKNNIPAFHLKWDSSFFDSLSKILQELKPDIVITNIHRILPKSIIELPLFFLNLHYSLLPSFSGLIGMKTIYEAKKKNTRIIGSTVHEVNEILDGGKILAQGCFSVDWDEPILDIIDKCFKVSCIILLNAMLAYLKSEETQNSNCLIMYNEGILFSPGLIFNPQIFTEDFWQAIK